MNCPFCGSEKVRIVTSCFPKSYECKACHKIFSIGNSFLSELE